MNAQPQTRPSAAPQAQAPQAQTQLMLDRAHQLEVRGRMDLAAQQWQQVLLADPTSTEALGGLARAAKLSGNAALAATYVDRLRAVNPNDPGIARVETMGTQADHNVQLQQAGKLAQQGQYGQSMSIYRQVYGNTPPPGDPALAYYETESATEDGRSHAVAGLRSLMEKNPTDSRYQVALGRILTYNPKTRPEGRKLLSAHPADPQAVEALRQSLLWDAQNPATAGDIRSYLSRHNDVALATALRNQPKPQRAARGAAPLTEEQRAANAVNATRTAEDQAAYRALNAKHLDDAELRFKAILAAQPDNANALAGMGYVRMQQANFGGAISFLTQAKADGSKDPGLDPALLTSRFWYTMGEGAIALNENDLPAAEKQYRAALAMRPASTEALEGLGGTLLKAQQPEASVPYFVQFTKLKPAASHAWRGLFLAEYGAGHATAALATERQIPSAVRSQLQKDPLFLRALASAYSSVGRDADAQRVLRGALDLPFPADAKGLEADTQLQYAALLQQANHTDQAAGLYRQVLVKDQTNVSAWQGLIRAEHTQAQDEQALRSLEAMPQEVYAKAMRDGGFDATVASIYEAQHRLDVAQEIIEKSLQQQSADGQKPSVAAQIQLAGIYLQRGNAQQAYPLYSQILAQSPDRVEAWKGLISALHSTGRDQEAIAQLQQILVPVRTQLESDVDYLQTVGSVYNALGQPQEAQIFLRRVQQHYATQHTAPPADVDVQNAWLLYNGMNDAALYPQLIALGARRDLNDGQRRTVQTIWANWAVRRANQAAAAGNNQRSLAILNATAHSFPGNPGVLKALAGGYARAGLNKQSVAIWKSQDLAQASAADYKSAVGAALAANDTRDAETWLRFGLNTYPKDAQLLNLAARFEQVRGDSGRAADYYRASLSAMPPDDPGAQLAGELSHAAPLAELPGSHSDQDLLRLLGPGSSDQASGLNQAAAPQTPAPPYLPGGASYSMAPVQVYAPQSQNMMGGDTASPSYPPQPSRNAPSTPSSRTRLRDYVPQAELLDLLPADTGAYEASTASLTYGATFRAASFRPSGRLQQQQVTQEEAQKRASKTTAPTTPFKKPGPLTAQPAPQTTSGQVPQPAQSQTQPQTKSQPAAEVYGPYVPYTPPAATAVQLGGSPPARTIKQPEVTDVLPTARYAPSTHPRSRATARPDLAASRAAAARRKAAGNPDLSGQSKPPAEVYATPSVEPAQYTAAPVTQQPAQPQAAGTNVAPPQQTGDSFGQQYPQPTSGGSIGAAAHSRARTARRSSEPAATNQSPAPAMSYPGVGSPLGYQPYPLVGPAYPLPIPPTDRDLMMKSVPPLRGSYNTGEVLTPNLPMTERQQTERDLAMLEASYSGWVGGTGSARYRSGTVGLDRLTDLETTFEASYAAGHGVRFTVVPRAVFLNSGSLDTTQYQGLTSGVPVLGTLAASAANAPAQQYASGIGGEFQITTRNFAAAAGYTPYEFLVQNFTGRVLFKPGQHFTLYANRDAVVETQLSYAGLRDPGSSSAVFGGNIWGGVISTGGGLRFDMGDERAGFYVTGDGADLSGYHVLQNTKFEGSMGAYFLAHTFPGYGRLNVGASLFGMHYAANERGLSYGLGGYFSPEAYFLASVPVTFIGRYHNNFHYSIAGSVGVQTFQEDNQLFFPLDRGIQSTFASTANGGLPCTAALTAAHTCAQYPTNSNTGGNYAINSEGAYRIAEHWFAGGFVSANNTNNYNTVTGGFFIRYLFRPQIGSDDLPTGLFPVEGFRPLRVP